MWRGDCGCCVGRRVSGRLCVPKLHAICEDYRAAASIDLEHDRADQTARITAPLLAIWGAQSVVGDLYNVKATWQEKANDVTGVALRCGHAIPEEAPAELTAHLLEFLDG